MYRIINSRSTGKTLQLMLLAKENNAMFACSNPSAMREKAHCYGLTGIDFIPYSSLFSGEFDDDESVVIDEIEELIKNYIDGKLVGYSLSDED